MPKIDFMAREIVVKIAYVGPPSAGKTTCLQKLHDANPRVRGKANPIVTPHPCEVSLDFVPNGLGTIRGLTTHLFLFTLRAPVAADDDAWKTVLRDVDALVFVADSQRARMADNVAARRAVERQIAGLGVDPRTVPISFLWNKRDLADAVAVAELGAALGVGPAHEVEGIASENKGVFSSLKGALKPVLEAFRAAGSR